MSLPTQPKHCGKDWLWHVENDNPDDKIFNYKICQVCEATEPITDEDYDAFERLLDAMAIREIARTN